MNKVTIVNLAGSAWNVEEDGVTRLSAWLGEARAQLHLDPDRDEIMLDFERAIADRFLDRAPNPRDVITTEYVIDVLTVLGKVEASIDEEKTSPSEDEHAKIADNSKTLSWRDRRLYRLYGPGQSQIAGVCSGIAAWLNVDPTIVRIVFVILFFATAGAMAVIYIALAVIIPEARSAQSRADALGLGKNAQEMIERTRLGAKPAFTMLGEKLRHVLALAAHVLRWVCIALASLILTLWGVLTAWTIVDPQVLSQAFNDGTPTWLILMWVTSLAWLFVGPIIAIARWLSPHKAGSTVLIIVGLIAWVLALSSAIIIPATNSQDLSTLARDGTTNTRMFHREFCLQAVDSGHASHIECAAKKAIVIELTEHDDRFDD